MCVLIRFSLLLLLTRQDPVDQLLNMTSPFVTSAALCSRFNMRLTLSMQSQKKPAATQPLWLLLSRRILARKDIIPTILNTDLVGVSPELPTLGELYLLSVL